MDIREVENTRIDDYDTFDPIGIRLVNWVPLATTRLHSFFP
jgi:hypothetical protein